MILYMKIWSQQDATTFKVDLNECISLGLTLCHLEESISFLQCHHDLLRYFHIFWKEIILNECSFGNDIDCIYAMIVQIRNFA